MTGIEVVEQNFNNFVAKEVVSALYYVSGFFTMVTSLCEDDEESAITRKEETPSKTLMLPKKQEDEIEVPKGLFALSFEKIPCDLPIKSCQYRTGRRYIQPDNFPEDDCLDHYLGLMDRLSSQMTALKTDDSTLSFDFASEEQLEFQMLSKQFVELFAKLDDNMLQALKSYYPHQVDFLKDEVLDELAVQEYFTLPNGEEDLPTLEEMSFYVKALALEGQDLSTKNPETSPKEYVAFLESQIEIPAIDSDSIEVSEEALFDSL